MEQSAYGETDVWAMRVQGTWGNRQCVHGALDVWENKRMRKNGRVEQ